MDELDERQGFVFQPSYLDQLMAMPDDYRYQFVMAIIEYGIDGVEPEFNDWVLNYGFIQVRRLIDASKERYSDSIENGKKVEDLPV